MVCAALIKDPCEAAKKAAQPSMYDDLVSEKESCHGLGRHSSADCTKEDLKLFSVWAT